MVRMSRSVFIREIRGQNLFHALPYVAGEARTKYFRFFRYHPVGTGN